MIEDKQLIRQYAAERSETAFAELVRRHLKMVYAAALRQVNGDTHLAEDVAQTVFADFARKAKTLQHNGSIAGWLFVSTRFVAANAVRAESRRRVREREVVAMSEINPNGNDGWNELRPLIDEALGELGKTDRESIVLRYFEGYEFSLVGTALGVSENAARMRVDRALEKLRVVLQKRGLATTGAALGAALTEATGGGVPAQLAGVITKAALAQSGLVAAGTPSILNLLAMNKLAVTVVGLAALAIAGLMIAHKSPESEGRNEVAASVPTAKATESQNIEVGVAAETESNGNAFQRTVQGHDAQVRAHQGETNSQEGDDADVPGVHKFTAAIRQTLRSGETLVTSGWKTAEDQQIIVCVTPTWIDPAGNIVDTPLATSPQVTVDAKFASVTGLDPRNTVFSNYFSGQNKSTNAAILTDQQFRSLINSIQQQNGADLLSCPRVTTETEREGRMAVTDEVTVNGQKFVEGPSVNVFPRVAEDGVSVDLTVVANYVTVDPAVVTSIGPIVLTPKVANSMLPTAQPSGVIPVAITANAAPVGGN